MIRVITVVVIFSFVLFLIYLTEKNPNNTSYIVECYLGDTPHVFTTTYVGEHYRGYYEFTTSDGDVIKCPISKTIVIRDGKNDN